MLCISQDGFAKWFGHAPTVGELSARKPQRTLMAVLHISSDMRQAESLSKARGAMRPGSL